MPIVRGKDIEILFSASAIARRNLELAKEIASRDYHDLLVISILKGSFIFAADLIRAMHDGHTIDTASDGEEGLDRIVAVQGGYDLVVSDIRMPAMDGIEMARAAVARFPSLKILLITGYAEQRERAAELEGTIVGVMQKPFTLQSIRERVAEALA